MAVSDGNRLMLKTRIEKVEHYREHNSFSTKLNVKIPIDIKKSKKFPNRMEHIDHAKSNFAKYQKLIISK